MNSDLWTLFIDEIHLLLGLAETDEAPLPYLERLSGDRSRVYAACEYLANQNKAFATGATWSCSCYIQCRCSEVWKERSTGVRPAW